MGAWGPGSFENDDALDWAAELRPTGDLTAIEAALDLPAASSDYIEAPECSAALAAAEVVAALDGRPAEDLPEEVSNFVRGRSAPSPKIREAARSAVRRVLEKSELLDLWEESDEMDSWRATVTDLQRRLGVAG